MHASKYLDILYEGYFMCRIATAPDPPDEARGVSGYTMALVNEDPLDQVIHLQDNEYVRRNYRSPSELMNIKVGVTVNKVTFDGVVYGPGMDKLAGAKVELCGRSGGDFAKLEICCPTIGWDETEGLLIEPFCLRITGHDVELVAEDYLNAAAPSLPLWCIEPPNSYLRRLPTAYSDASQETAAAIGVFNYYGYFRDRRRWLHEQITALAPRLSVERCAESVEKLRCQQQRLYSRLHQIELWGDRFINKIGSQTTWDFYNNGARRLTGDLGGCASNEQPWRIRFWLGGWDGDLLIGYMRGSVSVPFCRTT